LGLTYNKNPVHPITHQNPSPSLDFIITSRGIGLRGIAEKLTDATTGCRRFEEIIPTLMVMVETRIVSTERSEIEVLAIGTKFPNAGSEFGVMMRLTGRNIAEGDC
jgi:hypothetical protein